MYDCECCKRLNVPKKLPGIGYVCNDCLPAWCDWLGELPSHYPICPFVDAKSGGPG